MWMGLLGGIDSVVVGLRLHSVVVFCCGLLLQSVDAETIKFVCGL